MPLPLLFIGIAAATGTVGAGKSVKAGLDAAEANRLNKSANEIVQLASDRLNAQKTACGDALARLGAEKLSVLNNSITQFLDTFKRIKNIDFKGSEGLDELTKLTIDEADFKELEGLAKFAGSVAGGVAGGAASGAIVALGAYGAAQTFAAASTGTAIATLSGAAATNATLAFFGGGSLAAGGLGMAGGTMVLGGLVAGPALMVMGFVAGSAADKELEKARTNKAEAIEVAKQLEAGSLQCEAIRRRTNLFYNLLARLDARFLPLVFGLEDVVANEGEDFRFYTPESKKLVASCAAIAVSMKSVLDTPLLTDDGLLTPESQKVIEQAKSAPAA
ncbi:MAG: hypothetical protein IKF14_02850 [Atopobiaceae bacterium]|nr:hypothetical protein [Atopobiaceae bacterium]